MTESPHANLTPSAPDGATLPAGVERAIPRADGDTPEKFTFLERRVDIPGRLVYLRPKTNANIVFVLTFDELQHLAELTVGDTKWEEVG